MRKTKCPIHDSKTLVISTEEIARQNTENKAVLNKSEHPTKMRPVDETETTAVFEKLFKFVGNNLKNIVDNPQTKAPTPTPAATVLSSTRTKSTTSASLWSSEPPR